MTNQPMTDQVLFSLKSSGEALGILKRAGEQGFDSKYRRGGDWDFRFFQFLPLRNPISDRHYNELVADGLIVDYFHMGRRELHMTDKGVTYFRRSKC